MATGLIVGRDRDVRNRTPFPHEHGNLAVRVVQITKVPCLGRAGDDTGRGCFPVNARFQSFLHAAVNPIHTKVAFQDRPGLIRIQLLFPFSQTP